MKASPFFSIFIVFLGAILAFSNAQYSYAATTNTCTNLIVDKVWTGAPVGPTAISTPDAIFMTYYNQFRYITVAKVDLATCAIEKKQLSSQFGGYDTHNYIAMTFDKYDILHISGNMHADPLVYYRASKAFDISSIAASNMTGINESKSTYPVFFYINTNLYFMYRNGISGDGSTYINRNFELSNLAGIGNGRFGKNVDPVIKSRWLKLLNDPVFSSIATVNGVSMTVNAYPTTPSLGPDKFFHLAIDWRQTNDVASNYLVNYVKTPDFVNWFDAAGNSVKLPISSNKALPAVTAPGANQGLVNNVKLSLTPSGKPVVFYTQYVDTANGVRNGIFASMFQNGVWNRVLLASSNSFVEIKNPVIVNGASILPSFSNVAIYGPVAQLTYRFYGEAAVTLNLDPETFTPSTQTPVYPPSQTVKASPVALLPGLEADPGVVLMTAGYQRRGGPLMSLRWRSLPANNDVAFACPPRPAPYCNPPPSDLVLDTAWPK